MGSKTLFGSIKLKGSLADGTGDPLLTKDPATNEVGTAANALGSLEDGKIFVGDASNVPQPVAVSGDITLSNAGVAAIAAGAVVNADINAAAGIQFSKMEDLTASRALVSDANGDVSVSAVTATELGYLSGVTSAIQTQLSGKQATITGAASTITGSNLTANRALVANASGKVAVSSITSTELGHLSGASSNIQTQLNGKLTATVSSVAQGDILYYNGTGWVNLPKGSAGQALLSTSTTVEWGAVTANGLPAGGTDGQVLTKQSGTDFDTDWESLTVSSITDLTATAAELNILDGATINVTELNFLQNASANIQDQLNNKMSSTLATDHIFKGVGGVATASTDLPTGITIGGAAIYRASGADVSLADGGTGASLADPGADRIMFWDDSAGQVTWLEAGSGITITGTTISASGGIAGTLTSGRIPFATGASTLSDDSNLSWNNTDKSLTVGSARILTGPGVSLFIGASSGNTSAGSWNTGVGASTLKDISSGVYNTVVGWGAGSSVTTGNLNTLIGSSAGHNIETAGYNVIIGADAGTLVTGNNNILIGTFAADNLTSGTNNIVIGHNIDIPSETTNGQLVIHNALFGLGNTATGTTISSGRLGAFVNDPTASLDIAASTTSKASLRIRSGTAPSSPNAGDIWFDGTNLKFYDGTTTKTFTMA